MKAYKATDKNMQCFEFQYELNKEFIHNGELVPCRSGFHFCKHLINVFYYYTFRPDNRFFEVEIPDDAKIIDSDDKSITNKIKFIRELSSDEIKKLTIGRFYVDEDGGWVADFYKCFFNEGGEFHRLNGPALIGADGSQQWYQNGLLHREDGPARILAEWYQNGNPHRIDGPALIRADGTQEWWQHGVFIK